MSDAIIRLFEVQVSQITGYNWTIA